MIILPAIDLIDGKCVRLKQGAENTATIYNNNPPSVALEWQSSGAKIIHVVNLDGAFGRSLKNREVIKDIVNTIHIPIELGGGIRTFADAKGWLDAGVSRVIFGTVAITSPAVIKQTLDEFGPEKVIVGIDARQDKVAIDGWEKQTDTTVLDLALQMKELGIERIIYTDVQRDGESKGPNITNTLNLAEQTGLKMIASGGFSQKEHFKSLVDAGNLLIEGAIVGTALYENNLDLTELIHLYESK